MNSLDPDIVGRIAAGDVRMGARLISWIERGDEDVRAVLQALYRRGGRARLVGVTGPPGAGKSSLINGLIHEWRRRARTVAVLAVDPSSPFSGGAVLGDRLRMAEHSSDDGVFIRSMASRGQLGGLAKAAGDVLTVLDAMGWDIVVIETVGVGQNETDIMRFGDVVVLVQTPMGGDDIQAAKAGITEIADVYVVNKADHPDVERTVLQLEDMIRLGLCLHPDQNWRPPVIKTQGNIGEGISSLTDHIESRLKSLELDPTAWRHRQGVRIKHRVTEILRERLERHVRAEGDDRLAQRINPVIDRQSDPYALADQLLGELA